MTAYQQSSVNIVYFWFSFCSVYISRYRFLSLALIHGLSLSCSHPFAVSLLLSSMRALSLALIHARSLSCPHSCALSLSCSHICALSLLLSFMRARALALIRARSLSCSHSCAQSTLCSDRPRTRCHAGFTHQQDKLTPTTPWK